MTYPTRLTYPINALVSYHYFRKADLNEWPYLRLIGDCGAYSAMTQGVSLDVDDVIAWYKRWQHRLYWCASLDVIGDPEGTWHNYRLMRDAGLNVVPTVHLGEDTSWLDRYVESGATLIGLGGLVTHARRARVQRWVTNMFRYARDNHPDVRFHGWGATRQWLHHDLPWYSVDSSSPTSGYRYGMTRLFDPRTGRYVTMRTDDRDAYHHSGLLRRVYGVPPRAVGVSNASTRQSHVRLAATSMQLHERYLQRRKGTITAPRYGIRESERVDGPLVHIVDAAFTHLRSLAPLSQKATTA